MLDLEALVGEMHGLAEEVVRSAQDTLDRQQQAVEQVAEAAGMPRLREAVQELRQSMALPAEGRDMRETYPAPPAGDYTVIATDGSQVVPDYHHVAPWYVVNAGGVVLRYGAPEGRDRCRLLSVPRLLPPKRAAAEPDREADARASAASVTGRVELDRLEAELACARDLVREEADPGRTVLLLDGPLVQWRMIQELRERPDARFLLDLFQDLLEACHRKQTLVAGYISRSRAVAWITLLRLSLCPDVPVRGALCAKCKKDFLSRYAAPNPDAHHAGLAGLTDVHVAERLIPERYYRTQVLELKSEDWEQLTGGNDAAGFFYLNTGTEIARVEVPGWVWQNEALLGRLHGVLADQCENGNGYPMVLSEAHEQAVVRGPDRTEFYALVERVLNDHGFYTAAYSAKAVSKQRPLA
ncbi:MAG: DNA double-strand break repair nuclease NurA [Armatimonadota bacterium]